MNTIFPEDEKYFDLRPCSTSILILENAPNPDKDNQYEVKMTMPVQNYMFYS